MVRLLRHWVPGYAAVHRKQQRCSKVMRKEPAIPKRKYENNNFLMLYYTSAIAFLWCIDVKIWKECSFYININFCNLLQRCNSTLSPSCNSDTPSPVSPKPAVAKWASLTLPQKRAIGRDASSCSWGLSSRGTDAKSRSGSSTQHGLIPQSGSHHANNALPHAQVAHSELNVRLPRGLSKILP